MLDIGYSVSPNEIVILGDYLDCYGLSQFDKDPSLGSMSDLLDQEIEESNMRLDELDFLFPSAKKVFLEGNHEYRMKKILKRYIPALENVVSIETLLELDKRKLWQWVPFTRLQGHRVLGTDLFARHCPVASGSASNNARKSGDSIIYGHTHQTEMASFVTEMSARQIQAINCGWLGDEKQHVFDYLKSRPNWTKAFGVVNYTKEYLTVDVIEIKNNTAVYNGETYKA